MLDYSIVFNLGKGPEALCHEEDPEDLSLGHVGRVVSGSRKSKNLSSVVIRVELKPSTVVQ